MIYTEEMIKEKNTRKRKIKKIVRYIYIPLVIAFVAGLEYIGYLKYIKKTNDISIFGYRIYIVATGSMEPNYNIGDLIIVKDIPKNEIKVGDVVNYISDNGIDTVTHRVIEIIEKDGEIYYKTKGDNNIGEDPELINSNQMQGVISFKISKLGAIITKIFTITGIIIILGLILLSYLRDKNKEEKRIARENARKMYNVSKY